MRKILVPADDFRYWPLASIWRAANFVCGLPPRNWSGPNVSFGPLVGGMDVGGATHDGPAPKADIRHLTLAIRLNRWFEGELMPGA